MCLLFFFYCLFFFFFFILFFFQAEDGIRYLVRSRGLGDVYKRQVQLELQRQDLTADSVPVAGRQVVVQRNGNVAVDCTDDVHPEAVSYTHLTLPTSDLV